MTSLRVHLLPTLIEEEELRGSTVVVIDVLRATTTIGYALSAGAECVIPCQEVEEARRRAADLLQASPGKGVLLGGEREGVRIEGFDLSNSPQDYTAQRVSGQTIVFTTTNGTRAMARAKLAHQILLASFANFSAVCQALRDKPRIDILCAGVRNEVSREDVLLAGAIVDDFARSESSEPVEGQPTEGGQATPESAPLQRVAPGAQSKVPEFNDQAMIAMDAWQASVGELTSAELVGPLRNSRGGRNILALGFDKDVELAAQIDRLAFVPELDIPSWTIRPLPAES